MFCALLNVGCSEGFERVCVEEEDHYCQGRSKPMLFHHGSMVAGCSVSTWRSDGSSSLFSEHMVVTWCSHRFTWWSHGGHMVVTWWSHDGHMGSHDGHMVFTWVHMMVKYRKLSNSIILATH